MNTKEIKEFSFLGTAKVDGEYVAYLKNGNIRGTYRKDDQLKDYTIKQIDPSKVVLTNGAQIVTLKRGVVN